MELEHCGGCGCKIEGKIYNPYNKTFGNYAFSKNAQQLCKKCADIFVKERNKCKGGHWILYKEKTSTEELREIALDYKKRLG